MSSILSAISGHFSKSLILGTFLPALLFVVLSLLFLLPLFPYDWQVMQQLEGGETRGVLAVSFVAVVLAGLLYNLNIPVVRFYEGYTWQNSLLGRRRTEHYQRLLRAAQELRPRLQDVQGAMPALIRRAGDDGARRASLSELDRELRAARNRSAELLLNEFPQAAGSVLPTRLGNVIRSFEHYPRRQYGMSAITLWPRLAAKIEKDYGEQIDNAKTSFDFMINCSLLSFLLSALILLVGLWYPVMFAATRLWAAWLFKVLFSLALSYAFYRSSIGRASEWGELVKGAFDLYRHDLLAQLGHRETPSSVEAERRLWESISQQLIYGDTRRGANLPAYAEAQASARCEPETVRLRVTRGVEPAEAGGAYAVTLRVFNPDEYGRAAKGVVLTDRLPEGFAYVWDSARVLHAAGPAPEGGSPAPPDAAWVSGTSTMRFELGTLAAGESAAVRYETIKYTDGSPRPREGGGKSESKSKGAAGARAEVRHV